MPTGGMERGLVGSPRVLWVTEEPPDRALGGGSIRQAYLFHALAECCAIDLMLAGALGDNEVRAAAANVTELPKRKALMTEDAVVRRLLELMITLGSSYPLPAYMAGPARRALARAVRTIHDRYDVICVEHEALVPVIPHQRSSRWIVTLHHLLSGMIEREVALAPGRRQRWFRERDLRKAHRLETMAVEAYDRCIVCSSDDAAALAARVDGGDSDGSIEKIAVVPNGVDLARYKVTPIPSEPRVLFPGTFSYSPNVDAAVWLCSHIWPRVRESVPEATLVLAGRNPTQEVIRLSERPGVTVHPNVPSMVEYFASARVVVVPLRVGTGTRLKALEAMAAGRPVVGTNEGLAGLGIEDGVHARIADDPETFAGAVIDLLGQDALAASYGRAGRRHVEEHFDWTQIGSRFVEIVQETISRDLVAR